MNVTRAVAHLLRLGLISALAGGGAALWGYLNEPHAFFAAWLAGFYFWLAMPVGALALLLIWDLTGGRWEPIARLPLSAMAATMPVFIVLFLPIAAGMSELYSWTRPAVARGLRNGWYLNPTFFFVRAALYLLIWNGFAAWRARWRAGAGGSDAPRPQWVSALGVMLCGYALSFAGIDWIMSTEPRWFSSIYGMIVAAGQFIAALSFALVLLVFETPPSRRGAARFTSPTAALASILLAVVIFFAYASFCQWLIVWEENLHSEIHWFIARWRYPWGAVLYALAAAQFLVPFVVLVWTPAKRRPRLVGAVCVLLLLGAVLHVWWLLLPSLPASGFSWLDPAVLIGIGGIWLLVLAAALRVLGQQARASEDARQGLIHG
ncbi:MAG TPA: hypothetical protein VMG11_01225 [Steroidobacteraceae bacterium]|nr:hypothetical protein [Steroidobacteraceae bacterium]